MTTEEFVAIMQRYRIQHTSERELQAAVAEVLERNGVEFQRECVLSAGERIDFLLEDGVGVEIKIHGSAAQVARQLQRYAKCDGISALVLMTSRLQAGAQLDSYLGKPVRVLNVLSWA